jgi:hypothetical protein
MVSLCLFAYNRHTSAQDMAYPAEQPSANRLSARGNTPSSPVSFLPCRQYGVCNYHGFVRHTRKVLDILRDTSLVIIPVRNHLWQTDYPGKASELERNTFEGIVPAARARFYK